MESEVSRVLRRLEWEDAEDRKVLDRPREERTLALHPDTAQLLHILVQSAGCKNLVEVGVSHGYSTVWLAHAARTTGGRLISLEVSPKSIEIARRNLAEAGLSKWVKFVLGDARETLPTLEGPFDLLLLDCWDALYIELLGLITPLLRPGGLLVADNVTAGNPKSDPYLQAVRNSPDMDSAYVPIGRNIEVSVKKLAA